MVKVREGERLFANYSGQTQHPLFTVRALEGKGHALVVALGRLGATESQVQVPEGTATAFALSVADGASVELAVGAIEFRVS